MAHDHMTARLGQPVANSLLTSWISEDASANYQCSVHSLPFVAISRRYQDANHPSPGTNGS